MEAKIVYVVYGEKAELTKLLCYLVETEQPFHFSPGYCYFSSDPTPYLKEVGLGLTISKEKWSLNCLNFKDAPMSD